MFAYKSQCQSEEENGQTIVFTFIVLKEQTGLQNVRKGWKGMKSLDIVKSFKRVRFTNVCCCLKTLIKIKAFSPF